MFVQDTGECVARNQSIPLYARCEAHHSVNVLNGTSSGRPALEVVQLCVDDPLCDWDGYRERCVSLRNYTCHDQFNASECRASVGCYWNASLPAGARCRAYAWDGETKCSAADSTNHTHCESLGAHRGSCLFDSQTELCNPPLDSKPSHTSYGWRAFCAFSESTPMSDSANATECRVSTGLCNVTWDPNSVDACAPAGVTLSWCESIQTESLCDLYSFCFFAAGDLSTQSPNPIISTPQGPYTSGCKARNPAFGTDGWRDDWAPFVSDVHVTVSEVDSLYVRLEASVVVPQSTRDQGNASALRLWDVYIPHTNASYPNHFVSGLSGALGPVWGNVSDPLAYPTAAALTTALRRPSSASPISMNLAPLVYAFTGRQFETAHEFEGRNTMAVRVAASVPRADIEHVSGNYSGAATFTWNVSVHAVNASTTSADRQWLVRSNHIVLDTSHYQASVVTLVNVTNSSSTVHGEARATPVAAVSVDPGAHSVVEWLALVRDGSAEQPVASTLRMQVLRDVAASAVSPRRVDTTVGHPADLVAGGGKEIEWVRARMTSAPYSNASAEVGFTNWLRRVSTPAVPTLDIFYAFDVDSTLLQTPRGIRVPWVESVHTLGGSLQLLLQKQLAWELSIVDPWWQSFPPSVEATANATVWLTAVNSTGAIVAGPLAIDNTRSVASAVGSTLKAGTYLGSYPTPVSSNTSLYADWWESVNTLSRQALGGTVSAVPVVSTSQVTVNGVPKVRVGLNASALSYWLVPWFEQHKLLQCADCTFELSFVLQIPTPKYLNATWSWYDWDGATVLPESAAGRLHYVHREVAALHADLVVLVTYASATTRESLSHSAAIWAVVIWMCAVVFVIGVLLLSRKPDSTDFVKLAAEREARVRLADEQIREAQQQKRDALQQVEETNPFADANVVGIQDGGTPPPAVVNPDPDPVSSRVGSEMRKRYVNAMNPSGELSARLV